MGLNRKEILSLFSSVASRYDVMNDLMSFGVHRCWKSWLVSHLDVPFGSKCSLIDVASGTSDLVFKILSSHPGIKVVAADINFDMLKLGFTKICDSGLYNEDLVWICSEAESLPFPDSCFDFYVIAFGLRNVQNRALALQEANRVLISGGTFLCLEFSPVSPESTFGYLYSLYSSCFIPKLGKMITKNADAYEYLVNSIRSFPSKDQLAAEVQESGFSNVSIRESTGGIVALHKAFKT